jgi:microcystin-dependent protein
MLFTYRFPFSRTWLTQKLVDFIDAIDVDIPSRTVTVAEGFKLYLDSLRTRNLKVINNADVGGQLTVGQKVSVRAPVDTEDDLMRLGVGPQALFTVGSDGEIRNSPPITRLQRELAFIQAQIGDLHWSARATGLPGWVLCDGSFLNIDDFEGLFAVIGFTYGGGEGEFAVPDARGRALAAAGAGPGLTARSMGETVGAESHVLSTEELPAHSHTATASTAGSHSHTYNDAYYAEAGGTTINGNSVFGTSEGNDFDNQFRFRTADGGWSYSASDLSTSTDAGHTHSVSLSTTGESSPISLFQPTLFVGNVFIFTGVVLS